MVFLDNRVWDFKLNPMILEFFFTHPNRLLNVQDKQI